ncbi:hypothetical protein JL890_02145 [Staphylococcus pseudintermedius]|uniref:hypothetical protein n=1 Tax=Staphylococcus pseudintermedius TaxID=283734 RepID=UPI0015F1E6C3|nr:hypothetical protein [Staphylococcus pseudintermedius]EHT7970100.1 hypothetical protein [Staphylococcus pseudintermedius]EII6327552.1 hypothetical protein [Staphylococcus pseudintermedius]EJA1907054.1 hypothetical protein [Staphylococcus pseudintermedius]MCE5445962.1 hypothetical protein [Staphylococcus pseudintermedius]MCE5551598.1 hypothetical protein [Staphylococcus pseudintermedius]
MEEYWVAKLPKGYWNKHTEDWVTPVHATMLSSDTMTKKQAESWFKQRIDKPFVVVSLKINYYVGNYTAREEKDLVEIPKIDAKDLKELTIEGLKDVMSLEEKLLLKDLLTAAGEDAMKGFDYTIHRINKHGFRNSVIESALMLKGFEVEIYEDELYLFWRD